MDLLKPSRQRNINRVQLGCANIRRNRHGVLGDSDNHLENIPSKKGGIVRILVGSNGHNESDKYPGQRQYWAVMGSAGI